MKDLPGFPESGRENSSSDDNSDDNQDDNELGIKEIRSDEELHLDVSNNKQEDQH